MALPPASRSQLALPSGKNSQLDEARRVGTDYKINGDIMRGVVFSGYRKLELMAFDDPVPGPNEVVLEMKASGFCGSDLHHYRGQPRESLRLKSESFLSEHGLNFGDPIIAGHEP